MNLPDSLTVFDFTRGFDANAINEFISSGKWGIGRYQEKRKDMYVAPQYKNTRNIHMGIDIWAPAGEPVFAVLDGEVAYMENLDQPGNYGATVVLKHQWEEETLYALYGHLSLDSLKNLEVGDYFSAGDIVAWLGDETENGNWPPHLHYQLSRVDPGKADMPGVVAPKELEKARKIYPDPRILIGPVYE